MIITLHRDAARRSRARSVARPDEAPLRRTSLRLAALTVGLLCALLLVLGVTLYLTMHAAVLSTMQQTLQDRVASDTYFARDQLQTQPTRRGTLMPTGFTGPHPVAPSPNAQTNGTFCVILTTGLRLVSGAEANPFGSHIPDEVSARSVLHSGLASFSTQVKPSGARYLLYTVPIRSAGHTLGVIQTGLPEEPYLASLDLLLRMLFLVSILGLVAVAAISGVLVRRALQPIRAALQHQRDFVADAAHELRTPVTILRNAAELGLVSLADLELAPTVVADQQAAYEQTLAQSNHLAQLVDDLSLLARADSGALTLERQPVDLAEVMAEATAGMEMLAEERQIELQVQISGALPTLGDARRLRQVLLILLDNALKHTPDQGIITISLHRQGDVARLQVRDSGPGIAPADLPYLFERFYRADKERRDDGSGLGLAIARWITEAHGGRITAANVTPHGALFTTVLPLRSVKSLTESRGQISFQPPS